MNKQLSHRGMIPLLEEVYVSNYYSVTVTWAVVVVIRVILTALTDDTEVSVCAPVPCRLNE